MENNEFEKLDALLKLKRFGELDKEEKQWIMDQIGGESAYNGLRAIVIGISNDEIPPVKGSVKQSLIAVMKSGKSENQTVLARILNFRIPAYASFLLILLFITVYVITLTPEPIIVEKVVEVPLKPVIDTVYIRSEPDTVFVEKVIEKPVYLTRVVEKPPAEKHPGTLSGKSLAEQEEIRNLLTRLD